MKGLFRTRDLAVTQACVTAFLFLLIPLVHLLDKGFYWLQGLLHGLSATMTVMLGCWTFHVAFMKLGRGKEGGSGLERLLWLTNLLVLLAIISGNWLYMGYRSPDGPQSWLLAHTPLAHNIVMEWKEFVSLFPLPLGVAAGFILRRFGNNKEIGQIVLLLIALLWLCLMVGLVTGIGLITLHP
ncbi:hypothetical protein [Brevibacillus choshinensis]|uniref:Uncharacterized protein n=1 Tax=Brevibacillus choshinensis TaxID=54911 RepID=A0ABX7FJZ7_BRECH|nr:hypothetical protein [Brevibacillus choshinensis]QRG66541.1 hypothetical protein JNE38_23955 [Brevibacillus choshinensis]